MPRDSDHPKLNQEWLDAEEAAEYLRLRSVRALYDHVRRGRVPAHRLGRLLRFRRSELDAMLDAVPPKRRNR
jgi:excisionase family DNA binding protein